MLDPIYNFIGTILNAFSNILSSYLIALLIFAIIIKILLLPFGIKQQKSSIKQAKMRPKEMAIRRKYKGRTDKPTTDKMNAEIMELYQKEGYNPAAGCLPSLIQLPIMLLLYNVIMNPLRYLSKLSAATVGALGTKLFELFPESGLDKLLKDGLFTGRDISLIQYITPDTLPAIQSVEGLADFTIDKMPNFDLFGVSNALASNPSIKQFSWLILIPVLNFVVTFVSMKLSKKFMYQPMQAEQQSANPTMKMMDLLMPVMTTVVAFSVPAAIGIYWMFSGILSSLQQFILYKAMPTPECTEEDIKNAEKELFGSSSKKKARTPSSYDPDRPRPRSLHTIDFDDDEDEAPRKTEQPKLKEKAPVIEQAPLKDEAPEGEDVTPNDDNTDK